MAFTFRLYKSSFCKILFIKQCDCEYSSWSLPSFYGWSYMLKFISSKSLQYTLSTVKIHCLLLKENNFFSIKIEKTSSDQQYFCFLALRNLNIFRSIQQNLKIFSAGLTQSTYIIFLQQICWISESEWLSKLGKISL